MPYVETVTELCEELADKLGVYGAHSEHCEKEDWACRSCFVLHLRARVRAAVDGERALGLAPPRAGEVVASAVSKLRREALARALEAAGGNKTKAAEVLGVSRRTVYNWLLEEAFLAREARRRVEGERK